MSRLKTPLLRFITHTSTLMLADMSALVTSAIFVILLGRIYGASELGLLSYAMALSTFAQTIVDSGFDITLPRSISKNPQIAIIAIINSLSTKAMMWLMIAPLALLTTVLANKTTSLLSFILIVDIIPTAFGYTYLTALRGLQIIHKSSLIQGVYSSAIFLVCSLLVFLHVPLVVFALTIIIGDTLKYFHLKRLIQLNLSSSVSISKVYRQNHSKVFWNSPLLFESLSEQGSALITNILSSALVRIPTIILGWFSVPTTVGEYAAAARFYSSLRIVPGAFFNTILPEYSSRSTKSPRIKRVLLISLMSAFTISVLLYVLSPWLIKHTFTYQQSVLILQILSIGFFGLFLKTIVEAFLLAQHKEGLVNIALIVVSIFAVGTIVFYASTSPIYVAWCVAVAEWLLFISMTILLFINRKNQLSDSEIKV